jgi:histidine ammonia-lyase
MSDSPAQVRVGDMPVTLTDVVRVADGAPVELTSAAQARIRDARQVVDRLVAGDELIYGLNTGLGHLRDTRIPLDDLREYQEAIVMAHDGGIGPPLPRRIVRAAMFVRVAGIATGGSGVSPEVAATLVAMLNRGVHPVVYTVGSVGASDLMHMAAIAVVLAGLGGRAELDGELMAGPDAMRRAAIEPPRLEPKDGLALVSANGVAIGHAALVASRAVASAAAADLAVAVSLEAVGGNPSIVDPVAIAAKPAIGQVASAAHIRALLAEGGRPLPAAAASVQDPLSFRVAPQVHGALREFIGFLAAAIEVELASSDDNPYVSIDEARLISNGNFHPMVLALAADATRPAIGHVGLLCDRRLSHLWAAIWQDERLSTAHGLRMSTKRGGLLFRYDAAALYTELRELADPVTLDMPPLDLGVEDHATNATLAVRRTDESLDRLDDLLAIELLLARDAMARRGVVVRHNVGVGAAIEELDAVLGELGSAPSSDEVHAGVRAALFGRIAGAADIAIGR